MLGFLTRQRRLRMLYFAAAARREGVSRKHFLHNVLGPTCRRAARRVVEREECDGEYRLIYLKGYEKPLYYPKSFSNQALYGVIRETLPENWHYYEVPETSVDPGDVVFDIGAAEGIFAFQVADRAKHVHVFEPLPEFLRCLRRTFAHHGNVTIVPSGIADKPSTAWLKEGGSGSEISSQPTGTPISIESVDSYSERTGVAPTYIKADIEGSERRMLEGAARTISVFRPRIAITTYHYAGDADFIQSTLTRFNPDYRFLVKGIEPNRGDPLMLHAW